MKSVTERFLKYVSFHTTSDEESDTTPSSARQLKLAEYIKDEMISIGLSDVRLDDMGYVYGVLPASEGCEGIPSIGFISHMDTSPDAPG